MAGTAVFSGCSARAIGYTGDGPDSLTSNSKSSVDKQTMQFTIQNQSEAETTFNIRVSETDGGVVSEKELKLNGESSKSYEVDLKQSEDYIVEANVRIRSDDVTLSVGGTNQSGYSGSFEKVPHVERISTDQTNSLTITLAENHDIKFRTSLL